VKMTSITGNSIMKRPQAAFTLVEIIVSISILSIGLVVILQWFGHSLNILRVSENYLKASLMLETKMAEMEIKFREGKSKLWAGGIEEFEDSNISFMLNTTGTPIECKKELDSGGELVYEGLYKVKASLSWKEGKREGKIPLTTYLINHKDETE